MTIAIFTFVGLLHASQYAFANTCHNQQISGYLADLEAIFNKGFTLEKIGKSIEACRNYRSWISKARELQSTYFSCGTTEEEKLLHINIETVVGRTLSMQCH